MFDIIFMSSKEVKFLDSTKLFYLHHYKGRVELVVGRLTADRDIPVSYTGLT